MVSNTFCHIPEGVKIEISCRSLIEPSEKIEIHFMIRMLILMKIFHLRNFLTYIFRESFCCTKSSTVQIDTKSIQVDYMVSNTFCHNSLTFQI